MVCKKWWETESPQSKYLINTWKSMVRELKEVYDEFQEMKKLVDCIENCYKTSGYRLRDLVNCINDCYTAYREEKEKS
jgi:hypothetical protein